MVDLIIGMPHQGEVCMEWALALRKLILPFQSKFVSPSGMPIDVARNGIVQEALNEDARFLYFNDSDVIPPSGVIVRLMQWRLPVVSGLYYVKSPRVRGKTHAAMWRWNPKTDGYSPLIAWNPPDARLIRADIVGMGCCLIDVRVLKKLKENGNDMPFRWELGRGGNGFGEDFTFCFALKDLEIPVYVDTYLKCRHIVTGTSEAEEGSQLGKIKLLREEIKS